MFANAPGLSHGIARVAAVVLGTWPARRVLESPSWSASAPPPDARILEVDSNEIVLPASPYDVAPTPDGCCLFVSLQQQGGTQRSPGAVAVLHRDGEAIRFGHRIQLTAAASGLALVRGGAFLAVAHNHGVVFLDALAARHGDRDPIIKTAHYGQDFQAVQVLESADERWLFVSDEHNRTISILDLDRVTGAVSGTDIVACQIRVDLSPVGMALSTDGSYLYVACEMSRVPAPDLVNWFVWAATLHGNLRRAGTLNTVDLARIADEPSRAVVATTAAGGHPVRVKHSQDRQMAWVTARASNQLIAYSTESPENPAPVAMVPVGPSPVGVAVLDDLGVVLVANSNRFASNAQRETFSVVDIERALTGRPAILGSIPVGSFPREIVVDASQGSIFVTNFGSGSLSVIGVESLRRAVDAARTVSIG